jgi:hypothetical protein
MKNGIQAEYEGAIEALLVALAIQGGQANGARFPAEVLQHLADQPRTAINLFLG